MIAQPPVAADNAAKNTAAAELVHRYARDVVAGGIVANRYVRLAAARHLAWLARAEVDDTIRFDAAKAGKAIRFFSLLKLHEGAFEGKPFDLADWQAFVVGSIEGWYHLDEDGVWIRMLRNAYVETGKGSGKTPLGAGLVGYGMVEGKSGAKMYSAAAGRDQSKIGWNDFRLMVAKSPALRAIIETWATSLAGPKDSSFEYVSSEAKNLHGKRPYRVLIDEEHAHPTPEVIDAMRAGTKAWRDALIFRITNSGFDRHSVCWADHEYSIHVLEGVIEDDSWFAFVCGLDMCDEHRPGGAPVDGCAGCDQWTDEAVWPKANPNLGVSLPRQYLREMVREAIGKPAQRNIVKRLNFCIWTEGSGKWLDVAAFREAKDVDGPAPLPVDRRGYGGLDLGSTIDLTAFSFVSPRDECAIDGHEGRCYDLRVRFWLPEDNLVDRVKRDHVPYDVWADAGWITLTPGARQHRKWILAELAPMAGQLVALGYDRWGFDELRVDLQDLGLEVRSADSKDDVGILLEPVGQGYSSMSLPSKRLEADIAEGIVHHDGNPVLAWMVANAAADEDPAGNIKPDRDKSTEKIDGVVSWVDALFAMGRTEPATTFHSAYEEPRSMTL